MNATPLTIETSRSQRPNTLMASTAIGINSRTHEITTTSSFDARAQAQQEVKNNGATTPFPVVKIEHDENEQEETYGGGDDDRRECDSDDDHQTRNISNDSSSSEDDQATTDSHVIYLTEAIQQLMKENEQYQDECTALKRTVETLKVANTKRELRSMKALKQMRRQIDVLEVEKRRWYATQRRLEDEIRHHQSS